MVCDALDGRGSAPAHRRGRPLLTPACADTELLGDVCYMNAGWTKIHALMLDDFPMIDAINDALIGPSGTTKPANPCATNEC